MDSMYFEAAAVKMHCISTVLMEERTPDELQYDTTVTEGARPLVLPFPSPWNR